MDRCHGRGKARETQVGWMARYSEFDWRGLDYPRARWDELNRFDPAEWQRELLWQDELLLKIHARLPKELIFQRELLISRL